MNHPRLSVSEMCTYPLPFAEELAIWDELDIRQVGLIIPKVDAHGRDRAIAELRKRSMVATTVITGGYDLAHPETWEQSRASMNDAIDFAADLGGCVYFTPGRRDGRTFGELAATLAEAVAPSAAYAAEQGVRLAIEPTRRTDVSFVHTLRDSIDVADRAGIDLIADIGNTWTERDPEDTVRMAGARIAVVQLSDAVWGTTEQPSPGGRAVIGDGDLAVDQFVRAALDTGYGGVFELEIVGPMIDAEGCAPALRRCVAAGNAMLDEVVPA